MRSATLPLTCTTNSRPRWLAASVSSGLSSVSENNLCDAVAVAEVDESHTSHFTGSLHPACKGYFLALVAEAQLAAGITSIHLCSKYLSFARQACET